MGKITEKSEKEKPQKDKPLFDASISGDSANAIDPCLLSSKKYLPDDVREDSEECEYGCLCGCSDRLASHEDREDEPTDEHGVRLDLLEDFHVKEPSLDLTVSFGSRHLLATLDPADVLALKQEEKRNYRESRKREVGALRFPEYPTCGVRGQAPSILVAARHSVELEGARKPIGAGRLGKKVK